MKGSVLSNSFTCSALADSHSRHAPGPSARCQICLNHPSPYNSRARSASAAIQGAHSSSVTPGFLREIVRNCIKNRHCDYIALATGPHTLYYVEMPNPVVHFEIGARDSAAAQKLYSDLFDWTIQDAGPAAMISGAGLTGHITQLGHEPFHYTIFYVQVEDVAAHIAKAESLGCKKLVGPIPLPTGTFAWIADPEGNTIGLWKPA